MFDLKRLLGIDNTGEDEKRELGEEDIQLATSVLLINIAQADENLSQEEVSHIIDVLQDKFQIPEDTANRLFELSEDKIEDSIDVWQFTNTINQTMDKEEKLKIIENAWEVIYADEILDPQEDFLIHKLANLLRLTHKELIKKKLEVKNGGK